MVDEAADAPREKHSHRLLLTVAVSSLLVNAVLVAGIAADFSSERARDWTAARLDLASRAQARAAEVAAEAAEAAAGDALATAKAAPTGGELDEIEAAVSDVDLRLFAVEVSVAEQQSDLDAGCDWAKLQERNFDGTSLSNVFYDYAQSVCRD